MSIYPQHRERLSAWCPRWGYAVLVRARTDDGPVGIGGTDRPRRG